MVKLTPWAGKTNYPRDAARVRDPDYRVDPVLGHDLPGSAREASLRRRPSAVPLPEAATACYCEYHQPSRKSDPSGTMDKAVQLAPAGKGIHYERRRPEDTVLYQLIQEHLETFLAQVELETGAGLPEFAKEEFDAFLQCGILASERTECAGGELDLFAEMKARRFGLQHPQRDLYRVPIGMLNCHRIRGLPRPGEDRRRAINQWVERIVNRHRGRHGI